MNDIAVETPVCAIVVTRNRFLLLCRCIEAIRLQSRRPECIVVIDNDSSDKTAEWLACQTDLTIIRQANLGSAGGMYAGMKYAFEHGFAYTWLMDDDGWPSQDSLEKLMVSAHDLDLALSIVLAECAELPEKAAEWNRRKLAAVRSRAKGRISSRTEFNYNGMLVSRATIQTIGFPDVRFYLHRDDTDYGIRCRENGLRYGTVIGSIFWHPRKFWTLRVFIKEIGRRLTKGEKLKLYCRWRNHVIMTFRHYPKTTAVRRLIAYSLAEVVKRLVLLDMWGAWNCLRAIYDGFLLRWGREQAILNS